MKRKKIVATIQDIHDNVDQYLNYTTRLSKDYDFELELIAGAPVIRATQTPTAIVGVGKLHPSQLLQSRTLDDRKSILDKRVSSLRKLYKNINYRVELGTLEDRVSDDNLNREVVLSVVNQKSKDNFFNQVFGTIETNISKNTVLPTLVIPDGYEYRKPKKLLMIINSAPDMNNVAIHNFITNFDLEVTYVFQQDENTGQIKDMVDTLDCEFSDFNGQLKAFSLDNNGMNLDKLIEDSQPDWIGIKNYNKTVIERVYEVSTNSLVLSSESPIIIF